MSLYSRVDWFEEKINWFMVYYVVVIHAGAAAGLRAAILDAQWSTFLLAVMFGQLSSLGITAGAHRLWSHHSYKAHDSVRFFLMLCNSLANQGTIYQWCRDHRVHHKFVDTKADPHNSTRGFFYAHIGWMMLRKSEKVKEAGKKLNFDDLLSDWTVALQYKLSPWASLFMCFAFPTLTTAWLTGETLLNSLLVCGFLRYGVILHVTALVNSAAHVWGYASNVDASAPRRNRLFAMISMGEAWHLWHHKFPYDYAASELGVAKHLNPTRLLIDFFAVLGLVTDRRRIVPVWEKMKNAKSKAKGGAAREPHEEPAAAPLKPKAV